MATSSKIKDSLKSEMSKENRSRSRRISSDKALKRVRYVKLKVAGKTYTFDIDREVDLSKGSEDVLMRHTKRFVFWRRMLVDCARQRRITESLHEEMRSTLYLQYREQLTEESDRMGGFRPTEGQINAEVYTNPTYVQSSRRLVTLLEQEDLCKMMVEAFEHRKHAMIKLWRVTD